MTNKNDLNLELMKSSSSYESLAFSMSTVELKPQQQMKQVKYTDQKEQKGNGNHYLYDIKEDKMEKI